MFSQASVSHSAHGGGVGLASLVPCPFHCYGYLWSQVPSGPKGWVCSGDVGMSREGVGMSRDGRDMDKTWTGHLVAATRHRYASYWNAFLLF